MTDTTVKNNETTQKESDESTSKGDIKHIGYAGLIARRFFRQRSAVVGLIILLVLVFFALFGANIGKWAYDDPDFLALSAGPSASHWLGTDSGGSDLYAMVVRGLGKSLMIGIITSVATIRSPRCWERPSPSSAAGSSASACGCSICCSSCRRSC